MEDEFTSKVLEAIQRQRLKFSTAAKLTQPRQGTRRTPAAIETRKNAASAAAIASHNATMSANAPPKLLRPKKIGD